MSSHPYADVLMAIGERAKVSDTPWDVAQYMFDDNWKDCKNLPEMRPGIQYRIKPESKSLGTMEYPTPMLNAPKKGTIYYVPDFVRTHGYTKGKWFNFEDDLMLLRNNLCHETPEGAQQQLAAILGVLK